MNPVLPILIVVHAVTALFMAWPYYGTIITGERIKLGPPRDRADVYMENIIRQQSIRCMIFQITMFATGAAIIYLKAEGALVQTVVTNLRLLAKVCLVFLLVGMNVYMVFYLQPRIDRLLESDPADAAAARTLAKYRGRRRWMAAMCLWYVLMAVILGVQVWNSFGKAFILSAAVVAAVLVWRAYKRLVPYGFI